MFHYLWNNINIHTAKTTRVCKY